MSTFKSVNLYFPSSWTGSSFNSCWTYNLTHFPLFQDFALSLQRWRFLFHSIFWCFLWHEGAQEHVQNTPEAVESLIQTLMHSCSIPLQLLCVMQGLSLPSAGGTSLTLQQHGRNHRAQMPCWCEGWCSRHTRQFVLLYWQATGTRAVCACVCRSVLQNGSSTRTTSSCSAPCKHHGNSQWCPTRCCKQPGRATTL